MNYHSDLEAHIARINSIWNQGLDDLEKETVRLRKVLNKSSKETGTKSNYLLEKLCEVEKRHRHMVMRLKTNINWLRTYSIEFEKDDPCLN
jgi:hypothetical protein